MDAIGNVGNKKGCLLIQFPASIKNQNIDQLQHLLHVIQTNNPSNSWKIAIEFRDSSWYTEDTYNLVDAYGATIVIHDKSRAASPHMTLKSKTIYIRFHGPKVTIVARMTKRFFMNMLLIFMNGLSRESQFLFISTIQWEKLLII